MSAQSSSSRALTPLLLGSGATERVQRVAVGDRGWRALGRVVPRELSTQRPAAPSPGRPISRRRRQPRRRESGPRAASTLTQERDGRCPHHARDDASSTVRLHRRWSAGSEATGYRPRVDRVLTRGRSSVRDRTGACPATHSARPMLAQGRSGRGTGVDVARLDMPIPPSVIAPLCAATSSADANAKRGRIPASRIVVHRARQDRPNHVGVTGRCSSGERRDLLAGARRTTAGQQLVCDRCQREDVGRRAPATRRYARARCRPPHGRAKARALEGFDDAKAAGASFVRRDEDIAKVERRRARHRQSGQNRSRRQAGSGTAAPYRARGRVVPDRDVERLGGDVFFGPVGDRALQRRRRSARRSTDETGRRRPRAPTRRRATRACSGVTSSRNTLTATRRSRVGS